MRFFLLSIITIPLAISCGDLEENKSSDTGAAADGGGDGSADADDSIDADGTDTDTDTDTAADADGTADGGLDTAADGGADADGSPPDTGTPPADTADPSLPGDTGSDTASADTDTGETDTADTGIVLPPPPTDMDSDGWTTADGDCNDFDSSIHPARVEICDGIDNNCNDEVDEGVVLTWYLDFDHDGHGTDDAFPYTACEPLDGYVALNDDCDDTSAMAYPGADEICDEIDNNCDGVVDEDVTTTYFLDEDADGFGDAGFTMQACSPPAGYSDNAEDCNDMDGDVHPDATEVCDEQDNDCDEVTDEADAAGAPTFYEDGDEDGFGDPLSTAIACAVPAGYTSDSGDCDDNDNDIHPDAIEFCDAEDNDCDGVTDEGDAEDALTFFADTDGDGFGDLLAPTNACSVPDAHTSDSTDCNDDDGAVYPGAIEICNEIDDDCDEAIDDADSSLTTDAAWYADADGDGYGDADAPMSACVPADDWVIDASDCNDSDPDVNPGAEEIDGDGFDNNCVNDAPHILGVAILPAEPRTEDTLTLLFEASDPDGDEVTISVNWAVAGTMLDIETLELDGSYFSKGQFVSVLATPTDGTDSGSPTEAVASILNTAPEAPTVFISPDAPVPDEHDLICEIDLHSFDADGDEFLYSFSWVVDGSPYGGETTTTVYAGDTVPAYALGGSETWTCMAMASDDTEAGAAGEASVVTEPDPMESHPHDNGLGVTWYNEVPTGTINSAQAKLSCEQTYGTCYLSTGDCAGYGWCQGSSSGKCWGWESGCSGSSGRVWQYSSSYTTYGYWN
jgi:hypothetical protein